MLNASHRWHDGTSNNVLKDIYKHVNISLESTPATAALQWIRDTVGGSGSVGIKRPERHQQFEATREDFEKILVKHEIYKGDR